MPLNIRQYSVLTLLLVTLHIYGSEGQGSTCDMMSRPHPQGICGSLLAQAHSNLCFLLRHTYPHLFRSKRSTTVASLLDKVSSVPVSGLSKGTFRGSHWNLLLDKLEPLAKAFTNPGNIPRAITELSLVNNEDKLRRINDLPLFNMHKNLTSRMRREASQSSMVCDCCFNECTPRHLATYC